MPPVSPDPLGEASVGGERSTGPGAVPSAGRLQATEDLPGSGEGNILYGGAAPPLPDDDDTCGGFPFPTCRPVGPEEAKREGLAIVEEALELVRSLEPDAAIQRGFSRRVVEAMLLDMKDEILAERTNVGVAMWIFQEVQKWVARDPK
jgi:hypothetical protein